MTIWKRTKTAIRNHMPEVVTPLFNIVRHPSDTLAGLRFVFSADAGTIQQRAAIAWQTYPISDAIDCRHRQRETFAFMQAIASLRADTPGCIVEAGCFLGGSSAKFSLATALANRRLVIFDSFAGLPPTDDDYDNDIFGHDLAFTSGKYAGALPTVKNNIELNGNIAVCEFVPGWFEDTMPGFDEPIAAAYLDVDLASSTRTCLKYLYPLLSPGGSLFSQDGHIPAVIDVFNDTAFWENEVGFPKPMVKGVGNQKLLQIIKPID